MTFFKPKLSQKNYITQTWLVWLGIYVYVRSINIAYIRTGNFLLSVDRTIASNLKEQKQDDLQLQVQYWPL